MIRPAAALAFSAVFLALPLPPAVAQAPQPNVVVVLIDDMGWHDVQPTGSAVHRTPSLLAMAAKGACFTQACAAAPNCAPTRAALMSGQYGARTGVYTVGDSWGGDRKRRRLLVPENREELPASTVTLAEAFRAGGYQTACVGKWNLGTVRDAQHSPTAQGFDTFVHYKDLGFVDGYFDARGRYSTDVLFDEATAWIRRHAERPFFLYLAPDAVHAPLAAPAEMVEEQRQRGLSGDDAVYAAMVECVDLGMGRLQRTLAALGIEERTIVVFTSDNGGDRPDQAGLRGKKGLLYEGGLRVPLLMTGPGIRAGSRPALPCTTVDLYPTLLALCGQKARGQGTIDGIDLSPSLRGQEQRRPPIFFHFPAYIGQGEPSSAVRDGAFKLMRLYESGRDELYDLAADPGERRDLLAQRPDVASRLSALLDDWLRDAAAPVPSQRNPDYDPNAPRQRGMGGQARRDAARGETRGDARGDTRGESSGRREAGQQPWILAHHGELDADQDGEVTRREVEDAISAAMRGYDHDGDGRISPGERADRARRPKTALAGFVDQHSAEIDQDGDGLLQRDEVAATVLRMFERALPAGGSGLRIGAAPAAAAAGGKPPLPAAPAVGPGELAGAVYADNWFQLYANGKLVATDPTEFKPHDVVHVRFEATYPLTLAILAKDYCDERTGLEYDNTQIGDAGLIAKLGPHVLSGAQWKALVVAHGPIGRDMKNPRVRTSPLPAGWNQPGFDDSQWPQASTFTRQRVRPNAADFDRFDWQGADFIWSEDLDLDNTVLFRVTIPSPPAAAPGADGDRLAPQLARVFAAFGDQVALRWDDDWLYIETDAMPEHPMMVGIKAWNQQVPLPQPYRGANAWRLPLHPKVAAAPVPLPYDGPIAVAANGVPIFNPIKQNGRTDTFLAGELDDYGGHAGRGDDYHYHTAPVHLQALVGLGNPIAVAMDGYPIYGPQDLEGRRAMPLDANKGHVHAPHEPPPPLLTLGEDPGYHYHGALSFPYVHGAFHGEVDLSHRPQAAPVRPAGTGMRVAITGFERTGEGSYLLRYLANGKERNVSYAVTEDEVHFTFTDENGSSTRSSYRRRQAGRRR